MFGKNPRKCICLVWITSMLFGPAVLNWFRTLVSRAKSLSEFRFEDRSCLKKIGTGAFCECESRRCFVWPCCVELIPNLCFGGCKHLSGFHFEEGNCVQRIGSWVFSGCASLSSFICPGGVKSIGGDSFSCCVTLKFSFEDGSCWAIGSHCFRDCVSLCHFLVPVSVLLAMDASLTVFFLVILYLSARVLSSFARV